MDEALNHYSTSFFLDSPLNGQNTWAVFDFDWKSTWSPVIGNGYIDLFILGEMFYQPYDFGLLEPGDHGWESNACQLDPEVMDFMESETFSQLVITESAFSCMVNAISQSPMGLITLNTEKMNALFFRNDLVFDTKTLEPIIPIFYEKLNKTSEMEVKFHMREVSTHFSNEGIEFKYTLCMSWNTHGYGGARHLLYDEVKMITTLDMDTENDIMFINLLSHKLDLSSKFGTKSSAIEDEIGLSENEYREFLSTFSLSLDWMKDWLNENYFKAGVYFPWNISEFKTKIFYGEGTMHIMLEVE